MRRHKNNDRPKHEAGCHVAEVGEHTGENRAQYCLKLDELCLQSTRALSSAFSTRTKRRTRAPPSCSTKPNDFLRRSRHRCRTPAVDTTPRSGVFFCLTMRSVPTRPHMRSSRAAAMAATERVRACSGTKLLRPSGRASRARRRDEQRHAKQQFQAHIAAGRPQSFLHR